MLTVLLLGLLVLLYLNLVSRRKAQRDRLALQARLVPGAEVVTTSGLHGTILEIPDDGPLVLQIAPGTTVRWEKLAVGRVVSSPADAATAVEPGVPAEEPVDRHPEAGPEVEPAVRPVGESRTDIAPPDRG